MQLSHHSSWFPQPAFRIQYIPREETPQIDQEAKPAAPSELTATAGERIVTLRAVPRAPLGPTDVVEVFASIDNNRSNAQRVAWGTVTEFTHELPSGGTRWYWTRIRREVNGPDVFSEWLPASATGGVVATALDFAGELPSRGGVYLETFEHQDIQRFYDIRLGDTTGLSYPTDGENGVRVLQIASGAIGITWKQGIPYDPTKIYLMTVRARVTVDGGSSEFIQAGIEGVAADGVTIINRTGGTSVTPLHSFAASNTSWVTGTWQTFRGYLSGHNSSVSSGTFPSIKSPSPAYSSGGTVVRYIRPCLLINPTTATGTIQVDYMRIDIVESTAGIAPDAATSIESVEDDSVSLTNGGGVVLSDSLTSLELVEGYLLQLTATFDVWITGGGGTPEFYLEAFGNSSSLAVSQSVFPTATASPGQRVALQLETPITLTDETGGLTSQIVWTGAQPAGTAEVRNATLRSEKIKR
jgi:hypothetical protein